MSPAWNASEAPALPALGIAGRLRVAWRAPLALLLTAVAFAIFLALRGIDRLARERLPALAPFAVQGWAMLALPLLGLRLRRTGEPMHHRGALVANHASWIDIVALQRATRAFFVSKAEVAGWPGIGQIGRAIGTEFIERRPVEAKRQTERLHARLRRGDRLCLFPEGTSSDGQRVLPFKSSLFAVFFAPDLAGMLWVQPVTLRYVPRAGLPRDFYGWWGEMDFGAHLMAVLALSRGGAVEIRFHPPLQPAAFPDRKTLAAAAETAVAAAFEPPALPVR
ncbi:MAG: lysophospholipid acyltransferase family protein [Amaricoccus sp.]